MLATAPNKGFFFSLLVAWLALFQFLGNSTQGYFSTPSLLRWMYIVHLPSSDPGGADEAHGNFIPFIVLALFWWKRKRLLALKLDLWWPGLPLVGLALGLHLVGYMVQQTAHLHRRALHGHLRADGFGPGARMAAR